MMTLNPLRRWRRPALALLIAAFAASAGTAAADAPMAQGQGPGWYRMKLGQFEITALNDGTVDLPVDQLLTNTTPENVHALLARAFLKSPLETSVNGFLINTGRKLVLVDTGAAQLFGPTLGRLVTHLKASGYQPEQVDEVYITHMHPDHIGGLVSQGARTFPNAVVRADVAESGHWLSPRRRDAAPAEAREDFSNAMAALNPYATAGRFKPFTGETELVPGIRSLPAHGHTPGHSAYVVESDGQRLVLWGDLMHVAAVQFVQPGVTIQFDSDSAAAAPMRAKLFADAAAGGHFVAAAHLPFPGIGHLRSDGHGGYDFVPTNYERAK